MTLPHVKRATTESQLHRAVVANLTARGCLCIKLSTLGRYGKRGWPDLLVIELGGEVSFIELKRPGRQPTALQWRCIEMLRRQGCMVHIVRSVDELDAFYGRGYAA